jgi:hypothetical protein
MASQRNGYAVREEEGGHRMTAMQEDRAAGGTELEGQHKEAE